MTTRKHVQNIRGLQNLQTLRSEFRGSIPKVRRGRFLDLYVQEKEKERLAEEIRILKAKLELCEKKQRKTEENIFRIKNGINLDEIEEKGVNTKPYFSLPVSPQLHISKKRNRKR